MSTRPAGWDVPGVAFVGGRPRLVPGFSAEREGLRRYGELQAVAAVPPGHAVRRAQYWSFVGVADDAHRDAVRGLSLSYDLTVIPPRSMGWERPKTHGHVHVARGAQGPGFPELYEVLQGHAGFLVQNLREGPASTFAVLIEATAGQVVVIPPRLHHATVNLGQTVLVVADAICRASDDDYSLVRAAHGMAYYIAVDHQPVPNPTYRAVPSLLRISAAQWSGRPARHVYASVSHDPAALAWLCDPGTFASRFPALWQRVAPEVDPAS